MRSDDLQLFNNISSSTPENFGEIIAVYCGKNGKPQSVVTVKHKVRRLIFNSRQIKGFWLPRQISEKDKRCRQNWYSGQFWTINSAQILPQLTKAIIWAYHLENGTYAQNVEHIDRSLNWIIWKSLMLDELQVTAMSQYASETNAIKPKKRATTVKHQDAVERNAASSDQKNNKVKAATLTLCAVRNTSLGAFGNSFRNFPELWQGKPEMKRALFWERSSFRSGYSG